jgi:putative redox protein
MPSTRDVNATWLTGHRFLATTGTGFSIVMDNPSRDDGVAASPMDHVLAALAGCAGVDVVNILGKMRQPLERLEIGVQGTRRDEEPRVYTAITMVFRAWGNDLDPAKLARAVGLSEEKYCSVSAMLAGSAQISTRIELNGDLVPG